MQKRHPGSESMHAHGHGLGDDLPRLLSLIERRRALAWLAGGSVFTLGACGGSGSANASTTTTSNTTGRGNCTAYAPETKGPFPADGSNRSSGATSNALTASGVLRQDIRSSFIGSTAAAAGVVLNLKLTLVDTNASCAPLAGYALYLWHCDRDGGYSLYTVPAESYLRGVQVSDANGQLSFTTIFPGCYPGRWPHIHFEVYRDLRAATSGNALLTSQLALPATACSEAYAQASGYGSSQRELARITLARDGVFRNNSSAQLSAMTASVSGSVEAGFSANATVGLSL